MNWEPAAEHSAFFQKAIASLTRLQAQGNGLYQRKALATLASLYFSERDYASARDHFKKYLSAYPDTAWSWVAALRIGQSSEALNDWRAAVDAHVAAASKYASIPFARVLGHAFAARGYEALGQFNPALREYQAALAAWDNDYGPMYSLHITQNPRANHTAFVQDRPDVAITTLPVKVAQLKNSMSVAGGALLERGRWLVEHGRHEEAVVSLEQLLTRYGQSSAVPEARYLVHRARLGSALELADVTSPKRNDAAALTQLELIAKDPYDFGVCAAKIAKASILWRRGTAAEADSLMLAALSEWYEHQTAQRERSRNNIERDIAEIRNLVVQPAGDGVLSGFAPNTFSRGRPSASFVVLNPDISVKLPTVQNSRQTVYQSLPGVDRLLFLNNEQQAVLNDIVAKVGGKPEPDQTTEIDILKLWNRFLPTERRFGGVASNDYPRVSFESYPIITELEFLDAERTKAAARVVVGHQGGTVVLEKSRGIWTAKALVNTWIS
jgi:tetratricopeptide (TPR) repeat protein